MSPSNLSPSPHSTPDTRLSTLDLDLDPVAADSAFLSAVTDHYHSRLVVSAKPTKYLVSHNVPPTFKESDVWSEIALGYGDRTLGRVTSREARERLKSLGILKPNGREVFHGALTTPLRDAEGKVCAIYGRIFGSGLSSSVQRERWAGATAGALWNRNHVLSIPHTDTPLVICPTLIDALSCLCHGYRRVTFAVDDTHLKQLLSTLATCGVTDVSLLGVKTDLSSSDIPLTLHHIPGRFGNGVWRWLAGQSDPQAALQSAVNEEDGERLRTWGAAPNPAGDGVASRDGQCGRSTGSPDPSKVDDASHEEGDAGDIHLNFDTRHYRVRGLDNNQKWDILRINLRVMVDDGEGGGEGGGEGDGRYHLDHIDLYSAKDRTRFIKHASLEVYMDEDIIKSDIGRILLHLEAMQEGRLSESTAPEPEYVMSPEEHEEAMAFLTADDLTGRIVADFRRCGLVGEDTNALVGYLASVSRKLDDPLPVIIQSSSSAGKSSLMEAIMELVPAEDKVHLTTMTSQSLYYMQRDGLKHKSVAISESEGMQRASYALKLLQSEKRLCIATTGRDGKTGRQVTHHYTVEGPVQTIITSTDSDIDEELQNRAIVLTVSEDRRQTQAIHHRQRYSQTLEGMLTRHDREKTLQLHQNAQRLLEPVMVVNPHAGELQFDDSRLRARRDHLKYLNLIRSVALLHQHQRERKTVDHNGTTVVYIEATQEDIAIADTLITAILEHAKDDLAPQTRRLLCAITGMAQVIADDHDIPVHEITITRKQIREHVNIRNTTLGERLRQLVEHEYLVLSKTKHGLRHYRIAHAPPEIPKHPGNSQNPIT